MVALLSAGAATNTRRAGLHFVEGTYADSKESEGQTPLHLAASKGDWGVVRALLVAGADKEATPEPCTLHPAP